MRPISIDIIDLLTGNFNFLPDSSERCRTQAGIMADRVLHISRKGSIARPISIDVIDLLTDNFGFP